MLEWQSDQEVYSEASNNRTTSENTRIEGKPEAEAMREELSGAMRPMGTMPM
jgi:hypothetical protein